MNPWVLLELGERGVGDEQGRYPRDVFGSVAAVTESQMTAAVCLRPRASSALVRHETEESLVEARSSRIVRESFRKSGQREAIRPKR